MMMQSSKGRQYRSAVQASLREQGFKRTSRYDEPVAVIVDLHAPDKRTRDIDNYLKSLFDGLTHGGVWKDDSQVDAMTVRRKTPDPDKQGFCVVQIMPMSAVNGQT